MRKNATLLASVPLAGLLATAGLLIEASVFPISAFAGEGEKVDICHLAKGSSRYVPISLPPRALDTHLRHGDVEPGDEVPGMPGYLYGLDCVPVLPTNLQILAINDFHGHIATSSSAFGGTGRADFLAANIAAAGLAADLGTVP